MDEVAGPDLKTLIVHAPCRSSAENKVKLFGVMSMARVCNMVLLKKKAYADRLRTTRSVLIDQYRIGITSGKEFRDSPTCL